MMNNYAIKTSKILNLLISNANITEATLVKETGVPRATVNRLTSGKTPDPRTSTLSLIADYFHVSIDQLLGKEAIDLVDSNYLDNEKAYSQSIPIIPWGKISKWESFVNDRHSSEDPFEVTTIDAGSTQGKYAVKISGEAMWPQFQENTLLIVQPSEFAKNRDFVLVYLQEKQEILFRQLIVDGGHKILVPINSRFPDIELTNDDRILGVVIQTRNNLI